MMNRLTFKHNDFYLSKAPCTDDLVLKLGELEDLEEELGISLPILFKALKDGIWFIYDDFKEDFTKRPRLYYSDDFKCYCFEICFGAWVVKLKD